MKYFMIFFFIFLAICRGISATWRCACFFSFSEFEFSYPEPVIVVINLLGAIHISADPVGRGGGGGVMEA